MIGRSTTLVFPQEHHRAAFAHLFPGDGLEAAALLLCTVVCGERCKLLVREVLSVPYSACAVRRSDAITWPGAWVEEAIDRAEGNKLAVIAIHSHPGHMYAFSAVDDESDRALMPSFVHAGVQPAGSAIMTADGAVRARLYPEDGIVKPIDLVMVAGDDLPCWWEEGATWRGPPARPMAFTSAMAGWLGRMSACIIGVSGTGSIVAEQLARLGIGKLILIDFDKIEARNLNRIVNATSADVAAGRFKVDVLADAIRQYRSDCDIRTVRGSIASAEAVLAAADADYLFCCVDSVEGRHIADRLAAYVTMPLFDVGVSIPTFRTPAGEIGIADVCGRIDYVFPGGSTLLERGVYDSKSLAAEYLVRAAPDVHRRQVAEGYLKGVREQAPDVISVNMRAAATMVSEFLARVFPFRQFPNAERARTLFMLGDGEEEYFSEAAFASARPFEICAGLEEPLLGLPGLQTERGAA